MGEATSGEPPPPVQAAAILCRTPHGNMHAGLLHRKPGQPLEFLHLGWEDSLSQGWSWPYVWACPGLEPERLKSVAAYCRLVWKEFERKKRFPYGIAFHQTSFHPNGRLKLGEGARGLTCATFILAVFNAVGVQLVNEDSWPIRKDADLVFLEFASEFATGEHLAILTREIEEGARRIWPEEVLGACSQEAPAGFEGSREAGDRAVSTLESQGK